MVDVPIAINGCGRVGVADGSLSDLGGPPGYTSAADRTPFFTDQCRFPRGGAEPKAGSVPTAW
jgi:hypothetical protein